MVGNRVLALPRTAAKRSLRTIWKSLGATTLAIALWAIIDIVLAAPSGSHIQPHNLILAACTFVPILSLCFWRLDELEASNTALKRLAYRDAMLGCYNRRGFSAAIEATLRHASDEHPCTLLVVDIDDFKRVNDCFGYLEGDNALRTTVAAIRNCTRTTDTIGRLGGEEFGVLLPGADTTRARIIAARMRNAVLNARFAPDDQDYRLSVSVGGAVAEEPTGFTQLLAAADKHLFAAKKQGRDRVALTTSASPETEEKETAA